MFVNLRRVYFPFLKAAVETHISSDKRKDMKKEIVLTKDFLSHVNRFLKAWVVEIQNQKHGFVLPSASDELFKSCLKEMENEEEKTAFRGLCQVFQHTAFPWQENLPISHTMAAYAILESSLKPIRSTMLQMDMNWMIRTQLADFFKGMKETYKQPADDFTWWDGITVKPQTRSNNKLLAMMPICNDIETLGTSSARALAAPNLESRNAEIMSSIVNMVMQDGLGHIKCDGETMVEPRVKGALDEFLQVSLIHDMISIHVC